MLRKIRRSSKDSVGAERRPTSTPVPATSTSSSRPSFLNLPAELRNAIYELVVSDATLSLPPTNATYSKKVKLSLKKRKSIPTPLNGLLLASQQCRKEYLSVLLSTIPVIVEVKDFEFENLERVMSNLGDLEITALASNRHLTLLLNSRNCTSKDLAALRRWLDYQGDGKASLPWRYEFPLDRLIPATTMGRVRLLRELEYYADCTSALLVDLDDNQQPELRKVIEAFENKAVLLENDLGWLGQRSKSVSRNARGLAGGGIV